MIDRIDRWFGREIMQPPIIWLCQRTGMSQRAVSRYGWMLAAWTLVMRISFNGAGDWILSGLIILLTFRETAIAAMAPDSITVRNDMLRKLVLLFAAFDVVMLTVASALHGFPGFRWKHAWDLFALIAEYAKTIDTIPPRKQQQPAASIREKQA